ncbi:MAG: universal stress protein [Myxococcales bacterium]|nr:universal stress protein [Myxococcales bacterium]MCB9643228.1 universal stress protein [Myxococcales bacterium]
MKIQKILLATDFSSCSQKALEYAKELARAFQSKIYLLHVIDVPAELSTEAMIRSGQDGPLISLEDYLRESCRENLDNFSGQLTAAGLQVEEIIEAGLPYRVILHKAEHLEVDLIVMGTQGRTGIKHLFIGSTAERVVRQAPCPVMTIRVGEEE